MKRFLGLAMLAMVVACAPRSASAAILSFGANLNGPSESPPNNSQGTGFAIVVLDTVANTMKVHAEFAGLSAPTTASHIHSPTPTPLTGTAGVATTTPSFTGFPLGVTSGTFDSTLDMTLASSYNPAFVTANGGTTATAEAALFAGIIAGQSYYNIHSQLFPNGEIRGFLVPVTPEPSSLVLLASGALGIVAFVRRRGRKA